jgi:hypothetical protein
MVRTGKMPGRDESVALSMSKYRLKIRTDGHVDLPYSWEIFRADEEYPVEKSRETFRTALLAKMAGGKSLRRLEYQEADARIAKH